MNVKILKGISGLFLAMSLVSCGPGQKKSEMASEKINISLFPETWESKDAEIKGGTYKVGVVSGQPFKGILNGILFTDDADFELLKYIEAPLYKTDVNFDVTDKGLSKFEINADEKTVTVTLKEGLKWDDGQPMNIDDYIYSYEVLGSPKYTGVRYTEGVTKIKGMKEYHEGKAKTISGLEKVNDLQLIIHFTEMSPTMKKGLGGINNTILPKHYLSKIPIEKLEQSDEVRLKPVGAGQFKVSKVIPGESIEYVPNQYYYLKNEIPKVDKLIVKILPESSVVSSMKNGEFDEYSKVNDNLYTSYKDFDNLAILGKEALYYQYLGFNLGYWDDKKGENVVDPNAKLADIELRKAIAYSLDIDLVAKSFYNGLRFKANSPIPPVFKDVYDPTPKYNYNPEKANEILDKAGYKDVDGDGIREDKNGKPLELFLAVSAGVEIHEPMAQHYIQNMKKVGLKVSLTGGRLLDGQSFFERIQANDKEIDMWIASWGVGTALDLNENYGVHSRFNFSRITNENNEKLLNKINLVEGLKDPAFRVNAIKEWNTNYMDNVLGFLPLTFKYELTPINKRVKFATISVDPTVGEGRALSLTAQQTFKAK